MHLTTLKRSAEFQRLRGGVRWSGPGFLLEGKARSPDARAFKGSIDAHTARFGFTITRKLGGAVERNRIRRRLKEALRSIDGEATMPGFDYVVVARPAALEREFAALTEDFRRALAHLRREAEKPRTAQGAPGSVPPELGSTAATTEPTRRSKDHRTRPARGQSKGPRRPH